MITGRPSAKVRLRLAHCLRRISWLPAGRKTNWGDAEMYKTAKKTIQLIELLAGSADAKGVSDLARQLGWPKSNVHKMLDTLVHLGIVEQNDETGRYSLTLRLWEIGSLVQARLNPRIVALPYMRALATETGETIHLSVFEKDHVVYIENIESEHPVRSYSRLGGLGPAHCTATGKAMLAFQPPHVVALVRAKLEKFTDSTIINPDRLLADLKEVRRAGFAIQREEWRDGVSGIGAPIFDGSGKIVAGLGVTAPAARLTVKICKEMGPRVRHYAQLTSQQLGYSDSAFPPSSARKTELTKVGTKR